MKNLIKNMIKNMIKKMIKNLIQIVNHIIKIKKIITKIIKKITRIRIKKMINLYVNNNRNRLEDMIKMINLKNYPINLNSIILFIKIAIIELIY